MKKTLAWGIIIPLLVGFLGVPAFAQQNARVPANPLASTAVTAPSSPTAMSSLPEEQQQSPPGDLVLVDTLVLRPLGIVACGVGLVGSIVSLPFAAMTHSGSAVTNSLLAKPFDYTFKRKLGDVDY